jgi:hypothetical protein
LANPETRDEGSGGNARASRTRFGSNAGYRASCSTKRLVGKERYTGKILFSGVRPIPMLNRAFVFPVS